MSSSRSVLRRLLSVVSVTAVMGATAVAMVTVAPSAAADTPTGPGPVQQRPASMVTADALPTVQIDGVVWSQVIAGNTVYAGGKFANARPAGAAAGTQLTPRNNLLAYSLSTGALVTSFAPSLNAQALAVATSPNGSILYVGGDFTTANGVTRNHIAAYNTTTGALITTFAPSVGSQVRAIVATATTVYVGGSFGSAAGGNTRNNLVAFNASNGALTGWAPSADGQVNAMVMAPGGLNKLIVGGAFQNVNGSPAYGLAALDATSGALLPWAAGNSVRDAGANAAIDTLSTDGTAIYGAGWGFGTVTDGNLEGTFSADPATGNLNWIESCHGDTYSAYSDGTTVYTVSHAHFCGNVGGFPQSEPNWAINMRHTIGFTTAVTGVNAHDPYAGGTYQDWGGTPSPSMYNWFPDMSVGTYTGQGQAAWTVTGNGQYVVEGGEFPKVNGVGQQGLVRFAVSSLATNKQGPIFTNGQFPLSLVSFKSGTVRASWPAGSDRDDLNLTYKLFRQGTALPVCTVQAATTYWSQPPVGCTDTGTPGAPLTPGATYKYFVVASDPSGNSVTGPTTSVTVTSGSPSPYAQQVISDGAGTFWRLDQSTGTTVFDWAGFNDGVASAGVTGGTQGAIIGDSDTASTFTGDSTGLVATQSPIPGPNTFTISAWFKTNTTIGGKIVGFGDQNTGNSSNYDRHVYMNTDGTIWFGVYPGSSQTLNTSKAYNDGQWHQVVASLSPAGMALSIDGQRIASRTDVTFGQAYNGYWRVGGDSPWAGNAYFQGAIDDVAIFPTALSRQQVRNEYLAAGYTLPAVPPAPSDAYGKDVYNQDPDLYWRLADATGSASAADAAAYSNPGVVSGGVTLGQAAGALTGVSETAAQFDGASGLISSQNLITNPTTYSESLWFKTTTTSGGKLIGFGNAATGASTGYDRHVYMTNDGRLIFGTYNGNIQTLTTTSSYNDGKWHQVVASQGPGGMKLSVDGTLVASNASFTQAQNFAGYWRVGGDNLNAWPNQPSSSYFAGTIGEVAIYSTELGAAEIANQYTLATGNQPNTPPTASFTSSLSGSSLTVDASASSDQQGPLASYAWNFGDGTTAVVSTPTTSHTYTSGGTFLVSLTVTDSGGATAAVSRQMSVVDNYTTLINASNPYLFWRLGEGAGTQTALDSGAAGNNGNYQGGVTPGSAGSLPGSNAPQFDGGSGIVVAQAAVDNPTVYTEEAWFKTTSNGGGKIVGFGNAASGLSSSYDRHVYMDGSGHVNFGVWTGSANVATSPGTYADGQWHQVVATQGPDGLTLFIDGQSVATNPQTAAQAYSGYWRVGGDNSWAGNAYFNGQIDNVSIYTTELSAATILQHYVAGSGAAPSAAFTASTNGLGVSVDGSSSTASSTRTIQSYDWNWGDSSADGSGVSATHTYTAGGTYTVTLTVTDSRGVPATTTHQVTVHQAPDASFTAGIVGLKASVDGSASSPHDSGVSITKYSWTWGDGSPVQDTATATASHTYAAAGSYTIKLVVTDSSGAGSTTASQDVVAVHAVPVASFTASMSFSDLTVDASGSSASDGATLSYAWSWGDSTPDSTDVKPAVHSYAAVGDYTVTLTVTDSLGSKATTTKTVSASVHQAPDASFTAGIVGLKASVDGSASSPHDSGVSITKYSWTWGDGSPVQDTATATASHTYAAAGSYTIKLVVTDSSGAGSTAASQDVVAVHAVPVASFTASMSFSDLTVDASGSSASDGATLSYAWSWGDSTPDSTDVKPAVHSYAAVGDYTVTLTVTDSLGSKATTTKTVSASVHQAPDASFTAGIVGLKASVDGSASSPHDSGVSITKYSWTWGDGSPVQDTATATASHTYAAAGSYTIKLVVTDSSGAGSTAASQDVVAVHAVPVASFTASMSFSDLTVDASGSSASDGATLSYAWSWGDSTPDSTDVKPAVHSYAAVGDYTVTLTVTDSLGSKATTTKTVSASVHQAPTASFTATVTGFGVSVDGSGSAAHDSGVSITKYSWTWGDGSPVQDTATATASHTYAAAGSYTIKLVVTDSKTATGSITNPVTVTVVAQDLFGRNLTTGWGNSDIGGAWTLGSAATNYTVAGGVGTMNLTTAGTTRTATLAGVSSTNTNVFVDVNFNKAATGGGLYATLSARHTSTGDYRTKIVISSTGVVTLIIGKLVGTTETTIKSVTVTGLTYTVGMTLRIRFQVSGTSTAALSAKVWNVAGTEPTAWQSTTTDTTATLQGAGGYALTGYLSANSNNSPVIATFDNFTAVDLGA